MAEVKISLLTTSRRLLLPGATRMDDNTDFTQPWKHSDIVFLVEDQRIHANKAVLSMWSPVIEAMFTGDFKVSMLQPCSQCKGKIYQLSAKSILAIVTICKDLHLLNGKKKYFY